jgi:hypothetical protein
VKQTQTAFALCLVCPVPEQKESDWSNCAAQQMPPKSAFLLIKSMCAQMICENEKSKWEAPKYFVEEKREFGNKKLK